MIISWIKKTSLFLLSLFILLLLSSCQHEQTILTNVSEREANQIVVLLQSKGISAIKEAVKTQGAGGGEVTESQFNILVDSEKSVEALAILNRIGLPRQASVSILDLFPQQGMMKTDKEEQIRYNEGLNEQLASTLRMIDGILAVEVQISFPEVDTFNPDQQVEYPRASVFIKHDGILNDPNNLLVQKVRRYIAGSVLNLRYEDVTVVTDRARFTDISANAFEPKTKATPWGTQDFVKVWSLVIGQDSVGAFRAILFFFCFFMIIFLLTLVWLFWKFQNFFKTKEQIKAMINMKPFNTPTEQNRDQRAPQGESEEGQ